MKKPAFTLLELVLYIAIASSMVIALMGFSIRIFEQRQDMKVMREVVENSRFVMDFMVREIRDAEDIDSATYDTHPASITLDLDGASSLTIDTDTKTAHGQTIRFIQVDGEQITSDLVDVIHFELTDLTQADEPNNVQIELQIQSLNAEESVELRSSVSLRE